MSNKKLMLGVTLLELMIVVAIIGILAGVAYPSYVDFVAESNRTEAQRELLRYANLQEQYFVDNYQYAGSMKDLGAATDTLTTESGHYKISITVPATNDIFTLTATAQGAQATNDADCISMTINQTGAKTGKMVGGKEICW